MKKREVAVDGVYTLAGRIVRTVLALALSILVARVLGPRDRGLYALPTAVYTGLGLSLFTGISLAVSYFMLNQECGRGVLRPALMTGAIFTVLGSVPLLAMAYFGHNMWATVPALLLLPANVPPMTLIGYAMGKKRIRWQTTFSVLSTAALLAGMAVALFSFQPNARIAIAAFVAINLLTAAGCLAFIYRDAHATLPYRPVPLRTFSLFALRSGVVNVVTQLNYRADLYVVAMLTTAAILGQYAVAIAAAESVLIVTGVAALVTSPHVGSMPERDAARLTATCVRTTFGISLVVCGALYALAPWLVHLLYGSAYMPLVPALRILLVAVLILSIASPISNYFTLKIGKPEVALVSAGCAAFSCIVISWLLVPRVGMTGAAAATAVSYLLGEAVAITFFVRATGIPVVRLFIPTRADWHAYARFGKIFLQDVGRKLAVRA